MTTEPSGYKSVLITGTHVQTIPTLWTPLLLLKYLQLSTAWAKLTHCIVQVLCWCAPQKCILNQKEISSSLCACRVLKKVTSQKLLLEGLQACIYLNEIILDKRTAFKNLIYGGLEECMIVFPWQQLNV